MTTSDDRVLLDIRAERLRQDTLWGEQNHPDGTGPDIQWALGMIHPDTMTAEAIRDEAQFRADIATDEGVLTWCDILVEEVAEAFAENDYQSLRDELVQVAAVCVQWISALDRRHLARPS